MPLVVSVVILSSTFLAAPRYGMPEGALEIEPAAEPIRAAVLDWTRSLKSFSGSYVVREYDLDHSKTPRDGWTIEYRFEGDDSYVKISEEIILLTKRYPVRIYTYVDGILTETLYHKDVTSESFTSRTEMGTFKIPGIRPLYKILPPPFLFGHDLYYLFIGNLLRGISLEKFLSTGYSCVVNSGEQHVMKHFGKDYSIEFTVDRAGRVQRMRAYVNEAWRPIPENTRQRLLDKYDYDINLGERPLFEIQYAEYFFTEGVWFPLIVSLDRYGFNEEANSMGKELSLLKEQSNWTKDDPAYIDAVAEIRAKIATMKLYSISTTTISFKKDNLQVNVPLSKSSFVAELPHGAKIFDEEGYLLYRNTYWFLTPQAKRVWISAILAVLFLGICGFIFILYRRRNRKI